MWDMVMVRNIVKEITAYRKNEKSIRESGKLKWNYIPEGWRVGERLRSSAAAGINFSNPWRQKQGIC